MKFYLEQITTEENQEAKGLFEYESLDAAEIAFHSAMASAILNDNVLYARCRVINQYGMQNMVDTWQAEGAELDEKFYLSQVQTKADGTTIKALFDYASQDEAVSAWHSMLAQSMQDPQFTAVLGLVENRAGNEVKSRYWTKEEENA